MGSLDDDDFFTAKNWWFFFHFWAFMLNTRKKTIDIFTFFHLCFFNYKQNLIPRKLTWLFKRQNIVSVKDLCVVSFIYSKLFKYGIMTLSHPEKPTLSTRFDSTLMYPNSKYTDRSVRVEQHETFANGDGG